MDGSVLVCVQRVLHAENADYDTVVSGVTRHYVRVARGYGPLATAVHGLVDGGHLIVDASMPTKYTNADMRNHAVALESMLVAAISAREEESTEHVPRRMLHKVVPLVDELGDTVWRPALASANVPRCSCCSTAATTRCLQRASLRTSTRTEKPWMVKMERKTTMKIRTMKRRRRRKKKRRRRRRSRSRSVAA